MKYLYLIPLLAFLLILPSITVQADPKNQANPQICSRAKKDALDACVTAALATATCGISKNYIVCITAAYQDGRCIDRIYRATEDCPRTSKSSGDGRSVPTSSGDGPRKSCDRPFKEMRER